MWVSVCAARTDASCPSRSNSRNSDGENFMTTRIASRHTRDTVQLVSMFVGVVLILGILYAGGVADVVIIAALLAYILDPLVTFIEARGLSRSAATTALMLVLVACG